VAWTFDGDGTGKRGSSVTTTSTTAREGELVGILLTIGLAWCLLALGLAVVVGRAVRVADEQDIIPWVEIPEVPAFDERVPTRVR
jgi:hypothetical protein